ncbi:hypothetical protein HKX48_008503 [Thoreauomyces humboldtii]|nr:hypothetical protein HKX48_008503 [Thoreauomyces humboldtii]
MTTSTIKDRSPLEFLKDVQLRKESDSERFAAKEKLADEIYNAFVEHMDRDPSCDELGAYVVIHSRWADWMLQTITKEMTELGWKSVYYMGPRGGSQFTFHAAVPRTSNIRI